MNSRVDRIEYGFEEQVTNASLKKNFNVASWRGGLNYAVSDKVDVYSNVSTGFRTPTVNQLFAGDTTINSTIASNSELKPEETINYEIGLRSGFQAFGVGVNLEVAAFQIDRKNYIIAGSGLYSKKTPAKDRYENIGSVRNRGIELSLRTDESKPVSVDMAYTYLDAKFTKYDNFNLVSGSLYANPVVFTAYNNTGNTVPRVPNHHLNLNVTARPLSGLTVTGQMDAISSYWADEVNINKMSGHQTFNLLVNYDHEIKGYGTWSFFGRVDNVFDTKFYNTARSYRDANEDNVYNKEDLSVVVNPGRAFTVGITANF